MLYIDTKAYDSRECLINPATHAREYVAVQDDLPRARLRPEVVNVTDAWQELVLEPGKMTSNEAKI